METLIGFILGTIGVYVLVGALLYLPLLRRVIPTFDESMHDTPLSFKLLLVPGVVALWLPLLLKWKNHRKNGS